jgi:hypothetical protein
MLQKETLYKSGVRETMERRFLVEGLRVSGSSHGTWLINNYRIY